MNFPLRILHLEDDPKDAELIQATLYAGGYACDVTRVETRVEFCAALEQGGFYLILADYTLPSFDGISALKIAVEKRPEVPFIFVSGTLDEEIAIEALKIGAADYVFKTRLSRILPAFQRALREGQDRAERNRTQEALRRSEAYLAEAQRISHTGSFGWSVSTGELFWSEETFRIFQYDRTRTPTVELVRQRTHPEDAAAVKGIIERASRDRRDFDIDHRLLMPDGTVKHIHVVAHALSHESGDLEFVGAVMDVTQRKRAEALQAGEKRLLEMVARGESLAHILDSLCLLVEEQAGDALASILLLDSNGKQLRHGGAPSLPKAYTDAIDGGVIGPSVGSCGTAAYLGKQVIVSDIANDPLWVDYRELALAHSLRACWSTPIFSVEGKVIGTFAMYYRQPRSPSKLELEIIAHITDLAGVAIQSKLSEDALRRSEAYLAEAQRLSHTGSWARTAAGEVRYWSEECHRILGFDPHGVRPQLETFFECIHPEDQARARETAAKAVREKAEYEVDYRIVRPGGEIRNIHVIGHPILSPSGDLVEFVGTIIDMTERERGEESLRRSEGYLAEAQRLSHTGSWAWAPATGEIRYCSDECFRVLGFDPQGGQPQFETFFNRIHPDDRPRVTKKLERATLERAEFELDDRIVYPGGEIRNVHVVGHPVLSPSGDLVEFVGTLMDVTERKRAEEERQRLLQVQAELAHVNRVNMMGELTASLAHELNQPIAAAITNADSCLRWLAADIPNLDRARAAAMRIVKDGTRAAEIISRIRLLFEKGTPQRQMADVNEIIREMIVLLRGEATQYSISVWTELVMDLPKVMGDRVQLQQVMMNLMTNSIDAMKAVDGPRELVIKSKRGENGQLLLSVSDTGVGLPPKQADQIFNAFFTTKPHGTGMGLRICRSIIESHGGRLWAADNPPRGATFYLTLPSESGAQE